MAQRIKEPLELFVSRLYDYALLTGNISKKMLAVLIALGVIIRFVGLFGLGDADMEHFKSWAVLTQANGIPNMYSVSDSELFTYAQQQHLSIVDSFNAQRTWVDFVPLAGYWRTKYMVMYPPVSVYILNMSGIAYKMISPDLQNRRLFNAFVSFPMLLVSTGVSWLIFLFLREENRTLAVASALVYWLNPIVLLDSTIQGYNNPILILILLLGLICLYRRKYFIAVCLAALAFWLKPQGILLVPLVGIVCLRETKPKMWLLYLLFGIGVSFVVLLPFVLSGYLISSLLGATTALRSLGEWSTEVLSARSWNAWWPVQMVVEKLISADSVVLPNFIHRFGIDPKVIASLLMIILSIASLAKMLVELGRNRIYIFLCMIMMFYAYAMIEVNVQYNQFFTIIPILLMISLINSRLFIMTALISIPWGIQLFVYGGLGRDLCCAPDLITHLGFSWIFGDMTMLMSLINIVLWVFFCWQYFSGWFTVKEDQLALLPESSAAVQ